MKRAELEKAAFWEHEVCLDCGATFDPEDADEGNCPTCGSGQLIGAAAALRLIDMIEPEPANGD